MSKKIILSIFGILIIALTMGLFGFFNKENRFVTEKQYKENVSRQKKMNTQTISQLNLYGVTSSSELKLEFFFYTNSQEKANNLASELKKLNYQIDKVDTSGSEWLINGWSTKVKMGVESVTDWTTSMCKIGYENDCDFDGWGTEPDQDIEVEKGLTVDQYYDQGKELYKKNELRKSELYFSEAIKLDSAFPITYFNRAMVRTDLGNSKQALDDYTTAIKLKPDYHEAFGNRGALKDDLGDYDGAIQDYSEAIRINPTDVLSYSNRGNSKYRKGDNKGACEDWKKAVELGDKDAQSKIDQYCK